MIKEIYVIDEELELTEIFKNMYKQEKEYKVKNVKEKNMKKELKNIPSLIIINEDTMEEDVIEKCRYIRNDEDNAITPIIVISSKTDLNHRIDIARESVEYYFKKPLNEEYMYYTIKNLLRLLHINRRISPLTGLPGNVQIHAEMKKRLANEEEFAVLYADLDNFKAYNDKYGFVDGDEIIKYTANILTECVHLLEKNEHFVGHIGGDDFVVIVSKCDYEKLCQDIIARFDKNIVKFFNKEDLERGYIEVANRRGVMEQFPITSISIGAVINKDKKFSNILEIGEVGAQLNKYAKGIIGSAYLIDRRS